MKNLNHSKTMIIGIGNCGRQDDGLGWAVLDELSKHNDFQGEIIYRYQLNIEDAEMIKDADAVVFVDAYKGTDEAGYSFQHLEAGGAFEFSSHALKPEVVLTLCQHLYDNFPKAYTFWIKGYDWELETGLTEKAEKNLKASMGYLESMLFE
jgi:hydrogenase maturation protease